MAVKEQTDQDDVLSEDSFDSDDFAESQVSPIKNFRIALTN